MHFSLSLFTLAFATVASALPTELTPRQYGEAGPSGEVITPVGDMHYTVGDKIDFAYKRVITKGAWTNSLNIVLKTFDTLDGEEYSANAITVSLILLGPTLHNGLLTLAILSAPLPFAPLAISSLPCTAHHLPLAPQRQRR